MNILVCLKQTFDTEEKILIEDGEIVSDDVELIINPYCEYAVEEAIRLKEKHGGQVTVITVGGEERTQQAIRQSMAMGVDRGIWVDVEKVKVPLDPYSTSIILQRVIEKEHLAFDIILCGYMTIDQGTAQVGARLAELLDIPHISTVTHLKIQGKQVFVEKDREGDLEKIESTLPILLTAQQGLNEPRYPKLPDIMRAKRKPLHHLHLEDLELTLEEISAKTVVVERFLPPKKKAGQILSGEMEAQAKELVHLLKTEAKVI